MRPSPRALDAHAWANRLQTLLLVATLFAIGALAGWLVLGATGALVALAALVLALLLEPASTSWLTLRLYHARPLPPESAPELWQTLAVLARRAGLPAVPLPHYVPSAGINAFAVGRRERSAIALTDGLLRQLAPREIVAVLAHEIAHIAHGDLHVMGLADYVSRITTLLSLFGLALLILLLPVVGIAAINWPALLVLALAPHAALLAQLGLSRVREFDADRFAAELSGDPEALASALARIERRSGGWRNLLLPGWGHSEPSWLRTHPATAERIRRLLDLLPPPAPPAPEWRLDWRPYAGPVVLTRPGRRGIFR